MGGIESNPGWSSSNEASPEGERPSASGGDVPASDGGVAGAPHPRDAAAVTSDANDALTDMIAHAEAQMNLPASDVSTKRPPEQVRAPSSSVHFPPRVGDPFKLRFMTRLQSFGRCFREAEELEEDLGGSSERGAGSRRGKRRAMEERVVADFFAKRNQQRDAWAAREEEMFGPPSPTVQHDSPTDLEALEADDANAREGEPFGEPLPGIEDFNGPFQAVPPREPRVQADLLLHGAPLTGAALESTTAPSAGDIGVVVQDEDSEAMPSTPVAPKTGGPAQKKRRKRANSNPVPVDEAARAAGRAAVEAHRQTLGALRAPRMQREGQAVHQTELGDFGGPLYAAPVDLVTDAPIPNVGALVDRLQATRDAEKVAAREEWLKRYGRTRPLGAPRGTGDAPARTIDQDPSPSSPLPSLVLPSQEEDPALSAAQPPTAAPSSPVAEERAPPSPPPPPADRPPVDEDPGFVSLSQPHEPPDHAGHPPSPPLNDQPQEPFVIAPLPDENPRPEVVPGQPPAVARSPSPAHQEQAPVDRAQAPDSPNQPPAAEPCQPTAAEPSAEPSSALPPTEPPAQLPGDPPQVASVEDSGPGWCKKLEEALRQRRANGRAIVVAEDVHEGGAKRYGSLKDVAALLAHRRSLGLSAHLYELIQDDACWRIYFDLDLSLPTEDPSDFKRRLGAFHLVRDRFLTSVLNVPEGVLRFQACEAHGPARPPKQEFKFSVHEVLEGFYLRGLQDRRAFGKAFGCFLESPPDDLKPCVELLRKDGGSAYIWDGSIYGRHRCFRLLKSSKFGDRLRALLPSEGSSEAIADHLVCLYSEAELAGSTEISAHLLGEWATEPRQPPVPPRVGAFRQRALTLDKASASQGPGEDLSEQERAVLLARYQEDHAGAEIDRVVQERPGLFFVHFRTPDPSCVIAGRRHTSPGNQNPYLIYKRDEPRIARYQCFANSCRGECRVLPLDVLTTLGWTEDYEENLRMRPYPVFELAHVHKRTILILAKKGVGKSKAFMAWLVAVARRNPGLSFVLIGANVSLSSKYHQDLVDAGVEGVVLYLEAPPGPITASRVVICINSIHRVRVRMDVVAMDEMNMVLTNLNSEVMSQRGRVLSCLEAAVAGSKVIIGMDADIDCARVMEYLFMARPDGCPSTSKRFVKELERHFNAEFPPSESDRRGIFLHADKRSKADEDFFQKAMAESDIYLEADCVAFSPKLGPGVSKERPYAEQTVAFAFNRLDGPTVETLLQQHARFRTVTHSTIYYKQAMSTAVDLPRSTEAVFRAIERDDKHIVEMLGDAAGFQFLKGSQGICDRSSASCVLFANNILAKVESYLEYVPKLKADLEKQGYEVTVEHVEPTGGLGTPPPEVPLGFDAEPEVLTDEEWRAKYIISSEEYEIMCERPEDLSSRQELQTFLFEMVTKEYKVDPGRVDHNFYISYCSDEKDAKETREAHVNYLRFREHRFGALTADLDRALGQVNREGVIQEYVQEVREPVNRVPFAVRVLAFLVDCKEEQLDHRAERWEVSDERVQAAYAKLIGPSKDWLKTIFNMFGFVQQTTWPSKAADGKVREKKAQKRNAVGNVLRAGLGIELRMGSKGGGKFKNPHVLTPAIWLSLHERYGWSTPETVASPECMIVLRGSGP
ncbi:hypothetical protein KFL_010460010 [Klebsormidium nitens]|uniref:Replication origin-binding protein domain-containing protein n=1 Tax=Klebsormidium nitens TaxID=105231 RepID=A0A1Y1IW93_KLENI|nr:hypothetical protein KFL_010460010 [Klebsormidium nitens]|eukprot:GAQ92548.1 hypothetical protein KFL_010460010 [Klebsormidium nitens]